MKRLLSIALVFSVAAACGDVTSEVIEKRSASAGCAASSECPAGQPHCNPTSGQCVECIDTEDCSDPGWPICRAETGRCVECTLDAHCEPKELCSMVLGECAVPCPATGECPLGDPLCDTAIGFCVECLSDADCTGATPHCRRSECTP